MGFFPVDEPGRIAVAPASFGLVTEIPAHERYAFVIDLPRQMRTILPRWAMKDRGDWSRLAPGARLQYYLIPSTRTKGAFLPYEAEILPEGAEPRPEGEIQFVSDGALSRGMVSGFLSGRPVGFLIDGLTHRPASFTPRTCRDRGTWDALKPGMIVGYFVIRSVHKNAPVNGLSAIDVAPIEVVQEVRTAEALDLETTGDLMAAVA